MLCRPQRQAGRRQPPSPIRVSVSNVDLHPGWLADDRDFAWDKMHIFGQTISSAGHGDDIPILCRIAECLSKQEYIAAEVGLFHKRVGPDHFHQLVFGD
jgi:hypothetical protein